MSVLGTLYTFRRCPYAMRARMAVAASGLDLEVREILLAHKPVAFLELSPKGTVPVVHLQDGTLLEQSREIMTWALEHNDPEQWLCGDRPDAEEVLDTIDGPFKEHLDRYKYATRSPGVDPIAEREAASAVLLPLEQRLQTSSFLQGEVPRLVDVGAFPFVRQFAGVDPGWFADQMPCLQRWREHWQNTAVFTRIMHKLAVWNPDAAALRFCEVFSSR